MDRKEQIEVISFECIEIGKYYRYILKTMVDGESIQSNLQTEQRLTLEEFLEKAKDGIIRERYR